LIKIRFGVGHFTTREAAFTKSCKGKYRKEVLIFHKARKKRPLFAQRAARKDRSVKIYIVSVWICLQFPKPKPAFGRKNDQTPN